MQKMQQRIKKAQNFMKEKDYQMAQLQLLGIVSQYPQFYEAYYLLGNINIMLKNYRRAQSHFKHCILINSGDANTYYKLGICYQIMNQLEQAQGCYLQALIKDEKFDKANYALAFIYNKNGNKQKTYNQLQKAIKINPKNDKAYKGLGVLYMNQKRYNEAQQYLLQALNINKESADIYEKLGNVYYCTDQFEKAKIYYLKALQKSQNKAYRAHFNLGVILLQFKNEKEALQHIKIAQSMDIHNPLYVSGMAYILFRLNQYEQAFKKMNEAKNLVYSPLIDDIKRQCDLNDYIIDWVIKFISQSQKLSQLNEKSQIMSQQQKSQLTQINRQFIQTYISEKTQIIQSSKIKMTKRIQQLASQLQELGRKFKQMQNHNNHIKKQFEWQIKFQHLLQQRPKHSNYFKNLFSIFSTSILSYRAVNTGIVSSGGGVANTDVGGFVKTIANVLGIAVTQLPVIKDFCSIIISIGQFYLKQQKSLVIKQIVGATQKLYNQKILTNTTYQTIYFLAHQKQFIKMLQGEEEEDHEQQAWYIKILKKIQKAQGKINQLKKKGIEKISSVGGHNISKQMNLAMQHCSQILLAMIKTKYQVQIIKAQNPLLKAAQFWLNQQQEQQEKNKKKNESKRMIFKIIRLTIITQRFKKQQGKRVYCSISHGNQNQRSQYLKQHQGTFGEDAGWFNFQRSNQTKTINIKVMKKILISEDILIAEANIEFTTKIKRNYIVQFYSFNEKIGQLEILFHFV